MNASARLYLLCTVAVLAVLAVAAWKWVLPRFRVRKSELERRRRLFVNTQGRIHDAMVTDVRDEVLFYSYTISGVQYTAAQDISSLLKYLPEDLESPIGPATAKYAPHNPANSIVLCETWSGLRGRRSASAPVNNNEERSLSQ